jgi:uncharacterized membrane protein
MDTNGAPVRSASYGQVAFAVTMAGFGVMGLAKGAFTQIWAGVPQGLPARVALAYLIAFVSLGAGVGLLVRRTARVSSRALLVSFLAWLGLFRAPLVFKAPMATVSWWACGETAVMVAAAWVLYVWFAGNRGPAFARGDNGLRIARTLYGLGLIPFGIAHFTYLDRTVSMVPGYLPWHLAWAYFTGVSLIAAGVAVVAGVFARLATVLSAWEMGLFTLLVWGPVLVKGPTADDWSEIVVSWALTAAAWVVADSYRRVPWLAMQPREAH